jgi:hypothetical protein
MSITASEFIFRDDTYLRNSSQGTREQTHILVIGGDD